jgi:hypothetical protein
MRRSLRAACSLFMVLGPSLAVGQRDMEIGTRAKPSQTMLARKVVTISDSASHMPNMDQARLAMDSRKRFYMTTPDEPRFLVFDSTGRLLKSLGRKGSGPGEYVNGPDVVVGRGDTLYVGDVGFHLMVFAPDLQLVRTIPLAVLYRPIPLLTGQYGVVALAKGGPRIASQIEIYDGQGRLVKSFGAPTAKDSDPFSIARGSLVEGPDGSLWSPLHTKRVIEQWNPSGELMLSLTREIDPALTTHADQRHPVTLTDIAIDPDGRLWVSYRIPTGESRKVMRATEGGGQAEMEERIYHSLIELIDPAAGKVIASQTFPGSWMRFLSAGYVYTIEESKDGMARLSVLELSVSYSDKR